MRLLSSSWQIACYATPMLLRPDLMVQAAFDVQPAFLKAQGIRAVMVDLDDTLVASNGNHLESGYRHWFQRLDEASLPVVILSNGERTRVSFWQRELNVEGFGLVGKPFSFAFRRGLNRLGTKPNETVMIGDQLFTDILGANLAGMMSILVKPLSAGKLPHTRLLRHLERLILKGGDYGRFIYR